MLISFEGIDGSGKSTQIRALSRTMRERGCDVVCTREPGGSPGAEEIRALLVSGDPEKWSNLTEILLFTAARRDHCEKTIFPALRNGSVVLTDRFVDSTRAYQGLVSKKFRGIVDEIHQSMIGIEPDITVLIDSDPATSFDRAISRFSTSQSPAGAAETRFESKGLDFQKRLREEFLEIAADDSERFLVVDGNIGIEDLSRRILTGLQEFPSFQAAFAEIEPS